MTAPHPLPDTSRAATAPRWTRTQLAIVAAIVIAYAVLSHYGSSSPNAKGLGAALSTGPVFVVAIALLWKWRGAGTAVLASACMGLLLYRYWPFVEDHFDFADVVEQCGAYGLIGFSFARSLWGDRVPICTQMAESLHGRLEPTEIWYLRRATTAWAIFYCSLAVTIAILYRAESPSVWSLFVNFVTFGLIALGVGTDFFLRRWLLPRRREGGLLMMLQKMLLG